jgi:hypothetical protein
MQAGFKFSIALLMNEYEWNSKWEPTLDQVGIRMVFKVEREPTEK